jgi:hypothetical protein
MSRVLNDIVTIYFKCVCFIGEIDALAMDGVKHATENHPECIRYP